MSSSTIQPTFSAGEMAPSLYGRIDLAKYLTGLKICKNFIVRQYGGVANRPGTRLVVETKGSGTVRLIPFQFNTEQAYVLEFGNLYMRICMNGGQVVYPVGHISAGLPVEVVTLYKTADLPYLKFTQSADVLTIAHPDYPLQQLSRTDHHLWSFSAFANVEGPFQEINVVDTLTMNVNAVSGNVTINANGSCFTADMVGQMLYLEQSATATMSKWEVSKAVIIGDMLRAGPNYYQCVTAGTTGTVRPDHVEGKAKDGDPGAEWQYLHSGFGIIQLTGYTSATVMTGTVLKRLPDSLLYDGVNKTITTLTPGTATDDIKITIAGHGYTTGQTITASGVTGTTGANGSWTISVVDADIFTIGNRDTTVWGGAGAVTSQGFPSYKWALEAWGGNQGNPAVTTYSQQRQCFGASAGQPQTIWMSQVAGYKNFAESVPLLDDDGITFTISSREVNEIRHIVELSELIVLTSGGEWVIKGTQDGVFTPSGINAKRQGYNGSAHIAPIVIGSNALYVQEKGGQIRSLGYNFQNDAYVGSDLTILANHLFIGHTIKEWAFQQIPFSCTWVVRDDGILLGLTYMPEQEIIGWHQHETINGLFESVCSISGTTEDDVYFVVKRGSKRFIEKLAAREFTAIEDAYFVDCGLSYDGVPATVFSGLDHLNGQTVAIFADGHVHAQRVVTAGSVTLDYAASVVHVGLPITSQIETLNLTVSGQNILDKKKLINKVSLICEASRGIWAGHDLDHLREHKDTTGSIGLGVPIPARSGMFEIMIPAAWSKNGNLVVQQTDPLPLSILAIIPELSLGGA